MKSIIVLQKVSIPSVPALLKGQNVRLKDEIADSLVEQGFAKFQGENETATEEGVQKNEASVTVKKSKK